MKGGNWALVGSIKTHKASSLRFSIRAKKLAYVDVFLIIIRNKTLRGKSVSNVKGLKDVASLMSAAHFAGVFSENKRR